MKNLLFIIISSLLISSCTSSKTFNRGVFQKRKYTKGVYFNKKSIAPLKTSKNTSVETVVNIESVSAFETNKKENKVELFNPDSVKITLKNGDVYSGVQTEETDDGIMLLLPEGRTLFLLKNDIEEITVINSAKKTSHNTSSSNSKPQYKKKDELTFTIKGSESLYGNLTKITKTHYFINTLSGEKIMMPKQRVKSIYKANNFSTEKLHRESTISLIFFWLGIFTIPFLIGIILLVVGGVLSKIGFEKTELAPEKYQYKRAKRIKKMYIVLADIALAIVLGVLLLFLSLFL